MRDEWSNEVDNIYVPDTTSAANAVASPCAILVLGAGELGMAVLRHLARHMSSVSGVSLSVLLRPDSTHAPDVRKREALSELRSLGIDFVFGDLVRTSVAELATLFGAFHTVIGCTGFVGGRGVQLKLAQAAIAGGVKRYLPWQFGVDYDVIGKGSAQDLFDEQLEVRVLLRSQQATQWIIISTGMFTSFLFDPSFGVVDLVHNEVHALGGWENAVTVTTAEDIGRLTAEILFAEPKITDQVVYTAGDTLTYGEVADILDATLNRKVRRSTWTVPMLKEQLANEPESALRKYRVVFAEGKGVAWPMNTTFNAQRAIPVVGVERWVREHLR